MTTKEATLLQAIIDNEGAAFVREIIGDNYATVQVLLERGFVKHDGALDMACYRVTGQGTVALQDYYDEQSHRHTESIRYWITTAIAVVALIISIIALKC